jgi:hypothetical protein
MLVVLELLVLVMRLALVPRDLFVTSGPHQQRLANKSD